MLASALRSGMTFELGASLALVHVPANGSGNGGDSKTELGLGALDLSIGAFVSPRLAVTLRLVGS